METTTIDKSGNAQQKNHDLFLWGMQGFLFLAFGTAGMMKLTMSMGQLAAMLSWPGAVPEYLVRAIGAAELAGAVGVFLPALVRMQAWITSYAAMGLATVMICALGYHLMLFQGAMLIPTVVLGVIAGYVAWGRDKVLPFRT